MSKHKGKRKRDRLKDLLNPKREAEREDEVLEEEREAFEKFGEGKDK